MSMYKYIMYVLSIYIYYSWSMSLKKIIHWMSSKDDTYVLIYDDRDRCRIFANKNGKIKNAVVNAA